MVFVAIPAVWQMSGFAMALFLAGMRSIPEELREAARVDGASELQLYRRVILPLLRPAALSVFIILGHISLKIFDLIIALSGRQLALDVPAIYMWTTTFDANNFNRGAAIGTLLLLSVAVLVVPYLWYYARGRRRSCERPRPGASRKPVPGRPSHDARPSAPRIDLARQCCGGSASPSSPCLPASSCCPST
jgi:glucose/mannose transport system permease protein